MSDEIEKVAILRLSRRRRVPLQNALGFIAAVMSGDVELIDAVADSDAWPKLQEAWGLLLQAATEAQPAIQIYGLRPGEELRGGIPAIHPDELEASRHWIPGTDDLTDDVKSQTSVARPIAWSLDLKNYPYAVTWVDVESDAALAHLREPGLQRVRLDAQQLLNFISALAKPRSKVSRAATEHRCREWLIRLMSRSPTTERTKPSYRAEAQRLFPGLSHKAFNRAWTEALALTGAKWGASGPKPKASR